MLFIDVFHPVIYPFPVSLIIADPATCHSKGIYLILSDFYTVITKNPEYFNPYRT
jgi:hypothetical protein